MGQERSNHRDDQAHATNRAWWDERVPLHLAGDFYDVERFRAEIDGAGGFAYDEVGEVAEARLVHLQRHIGLDTLTLARRGARVTGLDFSKPAIESARRIAEELLAPGHPLTYFERFRALERCDDGYRFPAGSPQVPLMYSLHATKA
jgi:2-polyprenyl-3-methyl-5-hydroxy-6-metoxy-1,4-benzoquinol methylase